MGLRYGVAYETIEQYYPDLRSKNIHNALKMPVCRLGVCEFYDNGVISNIADFGIFARLSNGETGLLLILDTDIVMSSSWAVPLVLVLKINTTKKGRVHD